MNADRIVIRLGFTPPGTYVLVRIVEKGNCETSLFTLDHNGYLPVTIFRGLICGVDEI